jgi:hypothetical protein
MEDLSDEHSQLYVADRLLVFIRRSYFKAWIVRGLSAARAAIPAPAV